MDELMKHYTSMASEVHHTHLVTNKCAPLPAARDRVPMLHDEFVRAVVSRAGYEAKVIQR